MLRVIRRHPILTPAVVPLLITVGFLMSLVLTPFIFRVPQARPYVEVVTTRCLGADGMPVGEEFGQPCSSGMTVDTVVIQSHLPETQP